MTATSSAHVSQMTPIPAVVNDDSERQKDIYLVNVFYKKSEQDNYAPLDGDGVLLNFGDIDAIQVIKQTGQDSDHQ